MTKPRRSLAAQSHHPQYSSKPVMTDLSSTLQQVLVNHTTRLLTTADLRHQRKLIHFGPAAAYLWAGLCGDSALVGDRRLLSVATQVGDRLAGALADELGPKSNPPHVPAHDLADMFAALGPALTGRRRSKWQRTLRDCAEALSRYLGLKRQQLGKPGPYTGTGPNHLFRHAATLFRIAKILARPTWSRQASAAMQRLVRLQDPQTGCFAETEGPVVAYHWITLDGLARFLTSGGGNFALAPLQRGIDFAARQLYPDLVKLELFDERNRLGREDFPYLRVEPCVYHPQGRRLLSRVLERYSSPITRTHTDRPKRSDLSMLTEIARALTARFDASQKPLPIDSPRMTVAVGDYGLLRRRSGWFYGLSSLTCVAPPHNPFHMDRTTNFVLYHDRVGRIVAGGNDKHTLESATFRIVESGECGYFPAVAGRIRRGRDKDLLELDYGAARTSLAVAVPSRRLCRLTATSWTNMSWQQTDLNLQLWLPLGGKILLGPKRTARSLRPHQQRHCWPTGGRIELPGSWQIETAADATLIWPYLAYNPYGGPPHLQPPDEAVAVLTVPLEPVRTQATLTVGILAADA